MADLLKTTITDGLTVNGGATIKGTGTGNILKVENESSTAILTVNSDGTIQTSSGLIISINDKKINIKNNDKAILTIDSNGNITMNQSLVASNGIDAGTTTITSGAINPDSNSVRYIGSNSNYWAGVFSANIYTDYIKCLSTSNILKVNGNILPEKTDVNNLGSSDLKWNNLYINTINTTNINTNTLVCKKSSTASANNLYDGIIFNGTKGSKPALRFIDNTTSKNNDGYGVILGSDGTTIIGSGEVVENVFTNIDTTKPQLKANDEAMYICSDNAIYLYAGCNGGIEDSKLVSISANGNMTIPGVLNDSLGNAMLAQETETKNVLIGNSSYRNKFLGSSNVFTSEIVAGEETTNKTKINDSSIEIVSGSTSKVSMHSNGNINFTGELTKNNEKIFSYSPDDGVLTINY